VRRPPLGTALVALLVAGCAHDRGVGLLATQQLPVDGGQPVVLRASHGGTVNLIDQTTHHLIYNGPVTVGDDVVLDAAGRAVKVRGLTVSTELRPGDAVQITFD
jgi:hypothetical protein